MLKGLNKELRAVKTACHEKKNGAVRKILLRMGSRYGNSPQFVVIERIRRCGSYSLAGYVSVVRSRFDSSSRPCLVDRAFGSTKWIPHGTVLADW